MATSINTKITIQASAKTIWNILMDFENYPAWNPFIKSISGKPQIGQKIKVSFDEMTFEPTIVRLTPNKQFQWIGRLLFPGIFDGAHHFEIIENNDGTTTLIQSEEFKGILVPFLKKKLMNETLPNFKAMNEALKKKAEKIPD